LVGGAASPFRLAGAALGIGLYTAVLTPVLFWLLRPARRLVGMAESFGIR
jgi:hypothetical protein